MSFLQQIQWFQFHDGSIKGVRPVNRQLLIRNFNSTMVRLKGPENSVTAVIVHISIPRWFD